MQSASVHSTPDAASESNTASQSGPVPLKSRSDHDSVTRALRFFDPLMMALWFGVAAVLASSDLTDVTLRDFLTMRFTVGNIVLFSSLVGFWYTVFSVSRLYETARWSNSYPEILGVLKATSLGSVTVVGVAVMFKVSFINVPFLLILWGGTTVSSIVARLVAREMQRRYRVQGRNLRSVVVVGANPRSIRFVREIVAEPALGYRFIGFVDDSCMHIKGLSDSDFNLVADLEHLPAYLRKTAVDEVLICLPVKSQYDEISRITALCEEQGIMVRVLTDFFQTQLARSQFEQVGHGTFMTVRPHTISSVQCTMKHALDFILTLALLLVLSPVFLVTAIAIKLTSRGPVLFSQERIGLNKKRFRMHKFRTMHPDAEERQAQLEQFNEVAGPVFKIKRDPRITSIGKYLRRTSIDELPQLFNVLKGEMSLVGPRPLPIRDYDGFDTDWHRRRTSVRPGITGLWQIKGRSEIPFDKWMELDLQYINEWSLMLDFKVMLKTIPAILSGAGAT